MKVKRTEGNVISTKKNSQEYKGHSAQSS